MNPFRFLIILVAVFLIFSSGVAYYVYDCVSEDMPSLEQFENPEQYYATQVLSSDGRVLDHFFIERRVSLPFDSIPKNFINALIATEDKDFREHWGVQPKRIFNAVFKNIFMGKREGASTITQQLARSLFLNQETTLKRKIKEAFVAMQIEKTYTKEEILEWYANTVIYGRGAYGIMIASQIYLNKEPKDLTLSECAYLVGLLKGPEIYNGLRNYKKAIGRRNLVLSLMREQNYISEKEYKLASSEPINLARGNFSRRRKIYQAPHFVEMIRKELKKNDTYMKEYDLYRDGLVIYTTLDSRIQRYAEKAAEEHFKRFQKRFEKSFSWRKRKNKRILNDYLKKTIESYPEYISAQSESQKKAISKRLRKDKHFVDSVKNAITTAQMGMVVLDPRTGAVLAMVGASPKYMRENRGAKYSFNHAVQIKRQPGSSFKPFVYAKALEDGLGPDSLVAAGPFTYIDPSGNEWSPRGDGGFKKGDSVPLYYGLKKSINTVAARLITQYTTPGRVVELAKRLGINKMSPLPALALGAAGGVSPIEITSAFAAFDNDGIYVEPYYIQKIEDRFGNILYERNKAVKAKDAIKPKIAHQITGMLQGVVQGGTAAKVNDYLKNCDAAGKTGTTNDYADAWFVGFTPQLAAGVWVGFDDRRITFTGGYAYASSAAVPIWARCMAKIYNDRSLPYKQRKFSINYKKDSLEADMNFEPDSGDVEIIQTDSEKVIDNKEATKTDSSKPRLPKLPKNK